LARPAWGRGYATEGAKRCLLYGLNDLGLEQILAIAPEVNARSLHVMEKAGMTRVGSFIHPLLMNDERLKKCVVYRS
jgi:RimJ/RimL family protein N-acetyltransferase